MILLLVLIIVSIFFIGMGSSIYQGTGAGIGLGMIIFGIAIIGAILYPFICNIVKWIKENYAHTSKNSKNIKSGFKKVKKLKDNKKIRITKKLSKLYSNILELNNSYRFESVYTNNLSFSTELKSKRSLDNLDFSKYVETQIEENKDYYTSMFEKIKKNKILYNEYLYKYSLLEKYTTEEEFLKFQNIKMKYKTFLKCEKKIYLNYKLEPPIIDLIADCHATYTSPSGRNHYWRDASFSFSQLQYILHLINDKQKLLEEERVRKAKINEEKIEKQRKLRELDRFESQLVKKEQEIANKEKEFIEATKGHIYSSEKVILEKPEIEIEENLSLAQKLKLLKVMLDNGEISIEEYQAKRKELM